jgi:hypothetical protein
VTMSGGTSWDGYREGGHFTINETAAAKASITTAARICIPLFFIFHSPFSNADIYYLCSISENQNYRYRRALPSGFFFRQLH